MALGRRPHEGHHAARAVWLEFHQERNEMPNLSKARELREKRAKLVADARAIYDNSARTKEDNEKFDAMMAVNVYGPWRVTRGPRGGCCGQ